MYGYDYVRHLKKKNMIDCNNLTAKTVSSVMFFWISQTVN